MPQLARQTGTSLSDINIVPFVDVMLVLLIIFMITAPILQSGIDVDLPKTQTVKEISEAAPGGHHRPRRNWSISATTPSTFMIWASKVRAQMQNPQSDACILRCDETVPFGTFATVVDTLRQSGIEMSAS